MTEPWHRRWLHALEDDASVPGTPMQIARIYADWAVSKGGRWADVSLIELVRQTHRSRDVIIHAVQYLVTHGWLQLREPWTSGQAKHYDLTFPQDSPRHRPAQPAGRPSRPPRQNRPAHRTASGRFSRPHTSYVFYVSLAVVGGRTLRAAASSGPRRHRERERSDPGNDRAPPGSSQRGRGHAGRDPRGQWPRPRGEGPEGPRAATTADAPLRASGQRCLRHVRAVCHFHPSFRPRAAEGGRLTHRTGANA